MCVCSWSQESKDSHFRSFVIRNLMYILQLCCDDHSVINVVQSNFGFRFSLFVNGRKCYWWCFSRNKYIECVTNPLPIQDKYEPFFDSKFKLRNVWHQRN